MQKSRLAAITLFLAASLSASAFATRVGASSVAQIASPVTTPLEGTFWQALVVGNRKISLFAVPGPYLVFEHTGRFSGSDGCNGLAGDFHVNHDDVTFARIESTHMMCVSVHDVERLFDRALSDARRLVFIGDQFELLDGSNKRLVVFRRAL